MSVAAARGAAAAGARAPGQRDRLALAIICAAAVAIVLAASPYRPFDLDRFFVPKEIVLHVAAATAGLLVLSRARVIPFARPDLFLAGSLLLALLSALLAPNGWLAARAMAIAVSAAALFWSARALALAGFADAILGALAIAAITGAATSLLQAYGVDSDYFSLNRAPGGTFGNRNFVAHLGAIGAPLVALRVLESRRRWTAALWNAGLAVLIAALVLSRSRAAWLATIVSVAGMAWFAWRRRAAWLEPVRRARLRGGAIATLVGAGAALAIPNTLEWRSDTPYLDTVAGVVNYREGSGRGRLVQYAATLRMAVAHPVLGVGPGNWPVAYPKYAVRRDPSFTEDGTTANPWPSSDWAAIVSERGIVSFALLALALLGVLVHAGRMGDDADPKVVTRGIASGGLLLAVAVTASFDAVLLLAAPALVAWTAMGAMTGAIPARYTWRPSRRARALTFAVAALAGLLAVTRGLTQLAAMKVYSEGSGGGTRVTQLERAAWLDPGSYRIHIRAAEAYAARGNCARVRVHARAARDLLPNAPAPRRLLGACGGSRP